MTDAEAPLRRTPLYDDHRALGGRLVPFAGWDMPVQYTGVVDEHLAVRRAAGLFDVSHMGEFWLTGEHAGSVANYLVTNDVSRLEDGGALYTLLCNEGGTVVDDLIVYRHAADRILIVCNASNRDKVGAHLARFCENHCDLRDASDETGLIALQGPKAAAILAAAGPEAAAAVAETKSFRFRSFPVAGVTVTAARTGYTGEDGFELFCPWNDTPAIWRELLRLGESAGIKPVGLGARDTLRLEARLSLYGNEIDETTDPLEAGLGWAVKLEKGDFVGREALLARKAAGPSRKMVGFEMTGRGIARHGYPIKNDAGETVGLCTSGGPSPTTGKNIGLGYVPTELSAVGSTLLVDCRGRDTAAVVVKTPFYKANKAGALSPLARRPPMAAQANVRDDYHYTKDHEWLAGSGDEQLVGISAYAVDQLGDITLVNLDVKPGDKITAGKAFGTIESVKTLSDLFAPVSGTVVRVNADLETQPELVNEDPYGKAWLIAIKPEGTAEGLMDATAYRDFLSKASH